MALSESSPDGKKSPIIRDTRRRLIKLKEETPNFEFRPEQKSALNSINAKFQAALQEIRKANPIYPRIVNLDNFLLNVTPRGGNRVSRLTQTEREMVELIMNLDPGRFGIKTPRVAGIRQLKLTDVQVMDIAPDIPLLPKQKEAFEHMVMACRKATGETMYPVEGYRSKGYQLAKFIQHLVEKDNFDIATTVRTVALPDYSEHQSASEPAMDINVTNQTDDFINTRSYKWMTQHAREYGFVNSYPPGNRSGIRAEPWHWKFVGEHN